VVLVLKQASVGQRVHNRRGASRGYHQEQHRRRFTCQAVLGEPKGGSSPLPEILVLLFGVFGVLQSAPLCSVASASSPVLDCSLSQPTYPPYKNAQM
jgi:hypothetical protein